MSRRSFWIIVIVLICLIAVYKSQSKHQPVAQRVKHEDSVDPKERTPYHRPDGGFGTIDGTKDARDAANDASDQPKKTQDEIDKQ